MEVITYYLELIIIFLNIDLLQKLMKKDILTGTLFQWRKDKKHQKKNSKFIRINTSKENYDADYEFGRMQTFMTKLTKKLMVDEIQKMRLGIKLKQNHEIKSKTLEYIVNKKLRLCKK